MYEHALPRSGLLARATARSLAPWCACALVIGWAMLMAGIHPAQFSDSIEQYNWAHSLEWGYWKHPPLPTWMLSGAIALAGVSHWTAPVLAAACLAASVGFVWHLARMLLSERAAELAIILWPLHHALMWRAEVFNHNTVLVLLASATAWAAVRAWKSGAMRDWMLFGVAAGLALLSKYQALVTVIGVLVALAGCGALRDRRTQRGVVAAALIAFVIFLPHLVWAMEHDLPTLRYLDRSSALLAPAARVPAVLRFFGAQLGLLVTMLLAAAAARFWPARDTAPATADRSTAHVGSWIFGLVAVPLFAVALTVLIGGHAPQKMWGIHTTLFLPLWLAWMIERVRPQGRPALYAGVAAAVLVVANAAYAVFEVRDAAPARLHAADRVVPATELANAALADWRHATDCPLQFVSGDGFPAGLISVYSGLHPAVLEEDFDKSPWIDPQELRARGTIEVYGPIVEAEMPEGVRSMEVPAPAKFSGPAFVWWRVVPPQDGCRS